MKLKLRKKQPSARAKNLDRLYKELAVAEHNYENAIAKATEGSNDNQDRWIARSKLWLDQIESLSKTIETIEGNNQRRIMTTGEKVSVGASIVLPIFGTIVQWLPYTEKGTALAARMADRAEKIIERRTKK